MANPIAVAPGITPTTYVNIAQFIATLIIGGGGLYGVARAIALLWKMANDRAKQDNDAAAGVRKEMMELTDRLQKRVDDLETSGREERRHFDEEMTAIRKAHAEEMAAIKIAHAAEMAAARERHEIEMRALRDEVMGVYRDSLQRQQSAGRAALIPPSKAEAIEAVGNLLREANPLPTDEL